MDSPDIWMELTNIPYPYADLAQAFHERRGMDPRLNQSGPSLIVLPEYKPPVYNKGGPTFVTSSIRRSPPEFLDPKIHRNNLLPSILAKIEANAAGADAALMLDRDGFVAEGHGMHVFIVEDNEVSTSHTRACPEGITRQTVLDLCAANGIAHEVRDISTTRGLSRRRNVLHGDDGRVGDASFGFSSDSGPHEWFASLLVDRACTM